MKRVKLANTKERALIDDEDFELIQSFGSWVKSDTGYAVKKTQIDGKPRTIRMHRLVTDPPKFLEVDHINGNKLDNRKINLRIVSHAINAWNTKSQHKRIYKLNLPVGIAWDNTRQKFIATRILRKRFDTLDEAINYQKQSELYEYEHRRLKNSLPTGVYQNKGINGYQAKVSINGVRHYLGVFKTIEEAEQAYLNKKKEGIA